MKSFCSVQNARRLRRLGQAVFSDAPPSFQINNMGAPPAYLNRSSVHTRSSYTFVFFLIWGSPNIRRVLKTKKVAVLEKIAAALKLGLVVGEIGDSPTAVEKALRAGDGVS
ncbi:hypothetical protein GJ744_011052 [Endocarpon pusillum]|uniref:Uncharacterized protein n=1 Tax=Endocarpon pusillum TaxID=364733 RepID=A0A8H7E3R1_9EURO|nr:hypothetical protein GJ744_011052 [Endocarpon pusillum]